MSTRLRFLYRALRYRLRVDPAELRFAMSRLRPGQVAVDVGCHKGAYTYWLRWAVGASGEVIAFEPQPRQVAYLRQAFAKMRYANVTLVPMALSDQAGRRALHVPTGVGRTHGAKLEQARNAEKRTAPSLLRTEMQPQHENSQSGEPPTLVDVTTLDRFFAQRSRRPDFIKIDVEGHESAVLAGGRQILETHHPTLLVECEARHRPEGDVRPVFDFLHALGYAGSFFESGRRRPLAEFDPAAHQPPLRPVEKPPRGYVNNFAFEHPVRR